MVGGEKLCLFQIEAAAKDEDPGTLQFNDGGGATASRIVDD